MEIGQQKSQTIVDKNSGKTPHWHGEEKSFQISHLDSTLEVSVWNPSKKKEAICSCTYFLNDITEKGITETADMQLLYKGQDAGKLHLKFEFTPQASNLQASLNRGLASKFSVLAQASGLNPQSQNLFGQ